MPTTISYAGGTITPSAITGFESERTSGNIVHSIIGSTEPARTYRPAGLRTGTLHLGFASEAEAVAAEAAHATGTEFTISGTIAPASFTYIVAQDGHIALAIDATRKAWTLDVDFQEVTPS